MTAATANAMETAAANEGGAMNGFIGMNMAGGAMGGGFNAAQQFYAMGQQQQAIPNPALVNNPAAAMPVNQAAPAAREKDSWQCSCGMVATGKFCPECGAKKPEVSGWVCACGATNTGKFCSECGAKKPAAAPLYRCDKCGWEPDDPKNSPKFCPECGDRFTDEDIR